MPRALNVHGVWQIAENIGVLEGKTPAMIGACLFSLRMQVSLTYPLFGRIQMLTCKTCKVNIE